MKTLIDRINAAKASTAYVAGLKDYKVRSQHLRRGRALAFSLLRDKEGYFISTGGIEHNFLAPGVYGYFYNDIYRQIYLKPF